MAAGAGHRGLGKREINRPARFRDEEEEIFENDSGEPELPRRRRGRARAWDLWTPPDQEEGEEAVESREEAEGGAEPEVKEVEEVEESVNDAVEVTGEEDEEEPLPEEEVDFHQGGGGDERDAERQEDEGEEVQQQVAAEVGNNGNDIVEVRHEEVEHAEGETRRAEAQVRFEQGQDVPVEGAEEEEEQDGNDTQGEILELVERFSPEVPPPEPHVAAGEDSDGWQLVRRLGGWKAVLCQFQMLEECPFQHEEVWVWAWGEVLRRLHAAKDPGELDTALLWIMFLPQALLRKPTRGGRAGRGQVQKRFHALQIGNWGYLVEKWQEDLDELQERNRRGNVRRQESEEEEQVRLAREAASLISSGHISKAMRRLCSFGVASADSEGVLQQLRAKYPERKRALPHSVKKADPVPGLPNLRDALTNMKGGISPGCGGLRQEYLTILGRHLSAESMGQLEQFGMMYLRGDLQPWFYTCWLTVQCVPIFKTAQRDEVRPLGLRNPLVKEFHREVSKANREVIKQYVEPQQMVLSQGGGAKLVYTVRGLTELIKAGSEYEDWAVVKIDIRNAFNEVCRAETLKVIENEPTLQHLTSYTAVTLAPESGLECGGKLWGRTDEGGTQGDTKTGDDFAVTLQPSILKLDNECSQSGGLARAGADDAFAFAPKNRVVEAVKHFAGEVEDRCGLEVQWSKTELFSLSGELPDNAPEGMTVAGREIAGSFVGGFMCWGVPIGEDLFVRTVLEEKVSQILEEGRRSLQILGAEHRHAAWVALKQSIWPRFEYWAQNCYPSQTLPVARVLDEGLHDLLEQVVGAKVPKGVDPDSITLTTPLLTRSNWSFARWILRQPVKLGGAGLRSYEELCRPAFCGAVELSLPSFHTGFCPLLADIVGGEEEFGENWDGRWTKLLASECRVGKEYKVAWICMQQEARRAINYLGEEAGDLPGPLQQPVESAGEGSTSGATRAKLVETREKLLSRVLLKALEMHAQQNHRAVWSWPERDKLSAQFLLCLPGHDSTLTSEEFTQAFTAILCLPSPACTDPTRLGEGVGRRIVDRYGDNVVAQALQGDGYRRRHDELKKKLVGLLRWAGIDVQCEVFNLFSGLIPQEGLSRLERGRKRQGLVPDFLLRLPGQAVGAAGAAGDVQVLAELKMLSSCPTRYPRAPRARESAVTRRANLLPREYERKAQLMDRQYGGVQGNVAGPVERKLSSFPRLQGLVFGAWNEASPDVHNLVHTVASARLRREQELQDDGAVARRRRMSSEGALAILTGQVRRTLSLVAARAQARLLLDRLQVLGRGAAEANRRRRWQEVEERRMGKEQRAHHLSLLLGRALYRRGDLETS